MCFTRGDAIDAGLDLALNTFSGKVTLATRGRIEGIVCKAKIRSYPLYPFIPGSGTAMERRGRWPHILKILRAEAFSFAVIVRPTR